MINKTQVMTYKSSDHWIADIFMISPSSDGYSLDLWHKIEVNENGDIKSFNYSVFDRQRPLTEDLIQEAKQKLASFIYTELIIKEYWAFPKTEEIPRNRFDFILHYLKYRLPTNIREKLINYNSESFLTYISDFSTKKFVKKALFYSYQHNIRQTRRYDPKADFIICRCFDDPNLIVKMLSCEIKHTLFKDIEIEHAVLFLCWLQKYYHAKNIVKSIFGSLSYCGHFYTPTWINIIRMVEALSKTKPHTFSKYFRKGTINADALHNELIRINTLDNITVENLHYKYTPRELAVESTIDDLTFILPKSTKELFLCGDQLNNCLFAYNEMIEERESFVIGVYKNRKLTYAVEYKGQMILQAYGEFNTKVPDKDMNKINHWIESLPEIIKSNIDFEVEELQ